MINIPICFECKSYIDKYNCSAFPEGIPNEILVGEYDHRQPYEGDNGIQFEPIEEESE